MATAKAPKHDFAPAWLKIPNEESKPSGSKQAEHQSSSSNGSKSSHGGSRREKSYSGGSNNRHPGPDYGYLPRQRSFDAPFEDRGRYNNTNSRFRQHNSVDDDYYGYYNGYYGNSYGYDGYGSHHYRSQPIGLPVRGMDGGKYQHPHANYHHQGPPGPPGYPPFYDYPHDYPPHDYPPHDYYYGGESFYNYGRPGGKKNYYDKSGSGKTGKDREIKEKADGEAVKLEEEFPSLNGEEASEEKAAKVNGKSVWDSCSSKVKRGTSLSPKNEHSSPVLLKKELPNKSQSSSNMYKALVPNKILTRKTSRETMKVNGVFSGKDINSNGTHKSANSTPTPSNSGQSPTVTPAIEILNTRLVTNPKPLGDKKSDFLAAFKNSNSKHTDDMSLQSDPASKKGECNKEDHTVGDYSEKLVNGVDSLSVKPEYHMLSSSLEAEQRLLREMGWNEADQEEYVITEDEMKEFQNLTKQIKQQKNGLSKNLAKPWTPLQQQATVDPEKIETIKNEALSSDSDSDMD
ncbi:unnamed protein product [Owenia fusiformis]|uniref:Vasculin n=1 Tax=Owenia fusiformis TaxID=6347 RepID=A0A8S4N173_OWEFU|nr:unnamed protein product [Owenia fusiformis]